MEFRPKKIMVRNALDTFVIEILLEPSIPRLNRFKATLDRLQEIGYEVKHYTKMYKEIRKDYEEDREKWREATKKV